MRMKFLLLKPYMILFIYNGNIHKGQKCPSIIFLATPLYQFCLKNQWKLALQYAILGNRKYSAIGLNGQNFF